MTRFGLLPVSHKAGKYCLPGMKATHKWASARCPPYSRYLTRYEVYNPMATIKTLFAQPETSIRDIFIVGAGAFGRRAVERLALRHREASITVVDNSEEALAMLPGNLPVPLKKIRADGIETLIVSNIVPETWVIPAIPIHVALEWFSGKLRQKGIILQPVPIPEDMKARLPNPFAIEGRENQLFASIANFICPDNCPEPPEKCTHTGKPRPGNLYEIIAASIPESWSGLVLRSFQLAPGVGGYPASYLKEGLDSLEEMFLSSGNGIPVIIATACRCHGVINAVRLLRA
jgi:hypothetical protein